MKNVYVGWFMNIHTSCLKIIPKLFAIIGRCVNMDVEIPTDQELLAHRRQVLKEI